MDKQVDMGKYSIRTDLALDYITDKKLEGVKVRQRTRDGITITKVNLNKKNALNKKKGTYITLEFEDCTDSKNKDKIIKVLTMELKKIFNFFDNDKILIVGLGNNESTPDSLGPEVLKDIIVTNHIYELDNLSTKYRRVCAVNPGVMGTTGIETSKIIEGIVKIEKPNYIIVIDALASSSIERLTHTIQITDTGIHPGSGVGNKRKEISIETLGIPVLAIGVPTVVDSKTLVTDTINFIYKNYAFNKIYFDTNKSKLTFNNINYLNYNIKENKKDKEKLLGLIGSLNTMELNKLIFEVLNPIGLNLMVTPKEIDFTIKELSSIIAHSLNMSIHNKK